MIFNNDSNKENEENNDDASDVKSGINACGIHDLPLTFSFTELFPFYEENLLHRLLN